MNRKHLNYNFQNDQKNMRRFLLRSLLIVTILAEVVLSSVPGKAAPYFTDGDFSTDDWTGYNALNNATYTQAERADEAGNFYGLIALVEGIPPFPGFPNGIPSTIAVVNDVYVWDPSLTGDGPISSVSFQADFIGQSGENSGITFGVYQQGSGGTWFYPAQELDTDSDWTNFELTDLTASAFSNPGRTPQNPDFSETGAFIKFGVAAINGGDDIGLLFGVDNFQVTVNPVPIPSAVLLLGSALIGLFGLRRRFIKN